MAEGKLVNITLEQARRLYKTGTKEMKEFVLTVFTETELNSSTFRDIKTLDDVYNALNLRIGDARRDIRNLQDMKFGTHLEYIYKINLITLALNCDWTFLTNGELYYPKISIIKRGDDEHNNPVLASFEHYDVIYDLVQATEPGYSSHGLTNYFWRGTCIPALGLFACRNKEIAEHMGKYFAKEIFMACYGERLQKSIKWIEK